MQRIYADFQTVPLSRNKPTRPHPSWHWHASLHCGSTLILPIPFPFDFPPWSQLDEPVHFLTMDWKFRRLLSPLHPQHIDKKSVLATTCSSATPSQAARFLSLLCLDCILAVPCHAMQFAPHLRLHCKLTDDHHDATCFPLPFEPPPGLFNNALFCPTWLATHIHGPAGSSNS